MRGAVWMEKKEHDKAIADFDYALQINPNDSSALTNRGLAWAAKNARGIAWSGKKDHEKAIKDYDAALAINPKSAIVYFNRGISRKATKDYGKAIQDYDESIRLDPKYPRALNNLSWILATCPDDRY